MQDQLQKQDLIRKNKIRIIGDDSEELLGFAPRPTAKQQAYDVMVREGEKRGDKFKKVATALPRNKALRKGIDITDNYIEASFRLQKSKQRAKVADDLFPPSMSKFRSPIGRSKLPSDTFVELAKHRIDSIGEKQQLSYFKLLKAKRKASLIGLARRQSRKKAIKNINFLTTKQKQKKKSKRGASSWL